jgi:hypothetical protein
MDIDRCLGRSLLRALKQGRLPLRGLGHIAVGREGELSSLRRDLRLCRDGGGSLRWLCGPPGSGKTFLCSLLREEAWQAGFVVAAIDVGRDLAWPSPEALYGRIMAGLRTQQLGDVPALEFILQAWLFGLEQEVQRAMGLEPWHPAERDKRSAMVERRIGEELVKLGIYDVAFARAVRGYYVASQHGDELAAGAAIGWLQGEPDVPADLCRQLGIRGRIDRHNAVDVLQAVATLSVRTGYAGLLVIVDAAERLPTIGGVEARQAASETLTGLTARAAQGELAHCGMLLAGRAAPFADRGDGAEASRALQPHGPSEPGEPPLIRLQPLEKRHVLAVARKVRAVHGRAYDWHPHRYLSDALLQRFIVATAARCGERFRGMLRGVLKVLVDMLDALEQQPHASVAMTLATADHSEAIAEVERQPAPGLDSAPASL